MLTITDGICTEVIVGKTPIVVIRNGTYVQYKLPDKVWNLINNYHLVNQKMFNYWKTQYEEELLPLPAVL